MRTTYCLVPDEINPGHKREMIVPEWDPSFEQEYRDSQLHKASSKYQGGSTMFGYYDGDGQLTEIYVLVECGKGYWQLINSHTYQPWTDPLLLGPYITDNDLDQLTDGYSNMKLL